jgi:hypothetical protein
LGNRQAFNPPAPAKALLVEAVFAFDSLKFISQLVIQVCKVINIYIGKGDIVQSVFEMVVGRLAGFCIMSGAGALRNAVGREDWSGSGDQTPVNGS